VFDGRMEPSERRGIRPSDPDAELLSQLTDEGSARGFAKLDMTPGQVPDAGVRDASCAPMPQKHPLMLNQSPGHHVIHASKLITASGAGARCRAARHLLLRSRCDLKSAQGRRIVSRSQPKSRIRSGVLIARSGEPRSPLPAQFYRGDDSIRGRGHRGRAHDSRPSTQPPLGNGRGHAFTAT
jgi:hypothetical protein